ncbi:hypothetical protein [Cloacibacillus evryensis]|uniref:Guanylate cyclase domain-containing protein n=1 Tax=Cloacibacillus evryensis TaxID=508460 RepID=A0AAW5K2Z5_9BACT|nr:hypothetical protein [Cloacibacillus evryensis]MCQ4815006.1 hypothetical protein [Cloacibacillus evryensis]
MIESRAKQKSRSTLLHPPAAGAPSGREPKALDKPQFTIYLTFIDAFALANAGIKMRIRDFCAKMSQAILAQL